MARYDCISLTTDYGLSDGFVAACHGVLARLAPHARVIDVTHLVPPGEVAQGANVLAQTVPHLPAAVHVAVVDPGVGTARRAVLVEAASGLLVGPDNGLLPAAAAALGGIRRVIVLDNAAWHLPSVSATFHGRDVFAPVAAQLAGGAPFAEAGEPIEADKLVELKMPEARAENGQLIAHAVAFDRFGNVMLDVEHDEVGKHGLRLGHPVSVNDEDGHYATTFADVAAGRLLLYEDAYRWLALAVNRGSAADLLGLRLDDEVRIKPSGE